jgi:hypothetical protein
MNPNSVPFALTIAGGTLAGSLAITALKWNGLIDEDTALRAFGVVLGVMLMIYANFIPKQVARGDAGAMRFTGWVFVAAYLAYAAIWAFAPMDYTVWGSMAAIAGALVLTLAYCALRRRKAT